jgi:N-methylhydantoinase A/oxoprolinase/acetone carboxylase beta subunit
VIVKADGTFVSDKAQTTPKEFEICFFAGLEAACESLGKAAREVLPSAVEISYGTTAGTNILVTRSDAPQIGFITTKGAEDRTHIGRFRAAGLSRVESMHVSTADKPAPLVSRELIRGVVERIGSRGEVVIPLREDSVKQAVRELLAQGVEGIAVGLLWSPLNQTHEKRVSEIIKEMAPGLAVTISSEIASTIREYPRFISAIVDLYIGKPMRELLNRIEEGLGKCGYRYPLLVLQAAGGVSRAKVVKPGNTLNSGPVGGLTGVEYFAWLYGFKGAVGSDVGGTSFDVCAAMPEPTYIRQPLVGRFEVANPMREISTIGAGGGTMARVDAITKRLTVGPESAGAEPGPVCYGRGGIQPTVTDADVVLNRINPNYFLGGKIRLDKDKALTAIKEKIADPLGLDPYQAAEAICRIIDGKMLIALQSFISGKGIDPATYPLISYGGAGPTHCAAYARGIGFSKIIIPPFAAVFSAWGASTADVRHMYEGAPFITIAGLPFDASTSRFKTDQLTSLGQVPSWTIDRFNSMYENLEQLALEDMKAEGVEVKNVIVSHECEARYGGQLWEIRMPLSVSRLRSAEDLRTILHEFERTFLSVYGPLSLFPRGGLQILKLAVVTASPTTKASLPRSKPAGPDASAALKGERDVYFDGRFVPTKIYDMLRLQPGNVVEGEAVIEAVDTTVVIPRQCNITMDEYMNLVMVYR